MMKMMKMTDFVGGPVSRLLGSEPFKNWPVERTVEADLEERVVEYVFDGHGFEVNCDGDDNVTVVFLYAQEYGGFDHSLFEVPFSLTREEVLEHFGPPSKSGEKSVSPILGESGAWDHFSRPGVTIHVRYRPDADAISRITLMRSDVVPT